MDDKPIERLWFEIKNMTSHFWSYDGMETKETDPYVIHTADVDAGYLVKKEVLASE